MAESGWVGKELGIHRKNHRTLVLEHTSSRNGTQRIAITGCVGYRGIAWDRHGDQKPREVGQKQKGIATAAMTSMADYQP